MWFQFVESSSHASTSCIANLFTCLITYQPHSSPFYTYVKMLLMKNPIWQSTGQTLALQWGLLWYFCNWLQNVYVCCKATDYSNKLQTASWYNFNFKSKQQSLMTDCCCIYIVNHYLNKAHNACKHLKGHPNMAFSLPDKTFLWGRVLTWLKGQNNDNPCIVCLCFVGVGVIQNLSFSWKYS